MSSSRPRTRRVAHAVLGGTFDRFHVGHRALLDTAFRVGREVAVGVTTPRFLADHPKPFAQTIEPFARRIGAVRRYLRRTYPRRRWTVVPLNDAFGRSTGSEVGALVVSEETAAGAQAVNRRRRRLGRGAVRVVIVPTVLADDLAPVSSRRIRAGTIDRWGRRRTAIRIGVASPQPALRRAAVAGLLRTFRSAEIVESRVGPGPRSRSPRAASRLAAAAIAHRDLGVGVVELRPGRWSMAIRSPTNARAPPSAQGSTVTGLARAFSRLLRRRGAKAT